MVLLMFPVKIYEFLRSFFDCRFLALSPPPPQTPLSLSFLGKAISQSDRKLSQMNISLAAAAETVPKMKSELLNNVSQEELLELYRNISRVLNSLKLQQSGAAIDDNDDKKSYYNDSAHAWLYILFVLMFYAFSIVVLMIKYIRRERESAKLEYYYNEFVKRDWYKDKSLYDRGGRRLQGALTAANRNSSSHYEDPEELFDDCNSYGSSSSNDSGARLTRNPKKSVLLCVGAASILAESAALGMAPMKAAGKEEEILLEGGGCCLEKVVVQSAGRNGQASKSESKGDPVKRRCQ